MIFDRDATIEKLARLAARRRPAARSSRSSPRRSSPSIRLEPLGAASRRHGRDRSGALRAARSQQSVEVPGPARRRARRARPRRGLWLAVGVNELERGTIYNSLLIYCAGRRARAPPPQARADEPRAPRLGPGDGRGLETVDAGFAKVGGLICWENLMPLARFALYERGVEIYSPRRRTTATRGTTRSGHIARESRAFVLSCCASSALRAIRPTCRCAEGDELLGRGGSAIVAPDGSYLAGPLWDEEGILYADLDPAPLCAARQRFDPAGHYHRPDVLSLTVTPNK